MKTALTTKILCSTLLLAFSLTGCGNSPSSVDDPQNTQVENTTLPDPSSNNTTVNSASANTTAQSITNPATTESVSPQSKEIAEKLLKEDDKDEKDEKTEADKVAATIATTEVVKTSAAPVVLPSTMKKFQLQLKAASFIDKRFIEPSSLTFDENGNLYTVTDKGHYTIYKLSKLGDEYKVSDAINMKYDQILKLRLKKKNKFDFEGIEFFDGAFYLADERDRKVEKVDRSGNITDLNVDANEYMKAHGIKNDVSNSGFEGLTIDPKNKLMYLIKERQESMILVVDMNTNKVIKHFKVNLPGTVEPALTDASFFEGYLYVLVRSHRLILKINPETHEIMSTYDYRRYEEDPNNVYIKIPTFGSGNDPDGYGVMEGLAVTKDTFYVTTDNNMLPLKKNILNNKPQLFTFVRPE